jgi:hypothetical protein
MGALILMVDVTSNTIRNLSAGLRPIHALRLALLNYEVSKLQQRRNK